MSVYKRFFSKKVVRGDANYNNGTWYARGMVDGIRYHQPLKSAKTKSDASAEEDLIIAKIRHGEFDLFKDKTKFADFVEETYLPYCAINNINYKQKVYETNTLNKFFGKLKLKAISPSIIEDFKTRRSAETVRCQKCINDLHKEDEACDQPTVASSSVNHELSTLKKIFNIAIQNRKLQDNPMRFVQMLPKPKPRERYLSADEKAKLFEAIGDNQILLSIVLLGLSTG